MKTYVITIPIDIFGEGYDETVKVTAPSEEVAAAVAAREVQKEVKVFADEYEVEVTEDTIGAIPADPRPSVFLTLGAFDIARLGKEALYASVEQKLTEKGINIEVVEMEMIPVSFDEDKDVTYLCIVTDFEEGK